jgi:hypothetical protein
MLERKYGRNGWKMSIFHPIRRVKLVCHYGKNGSKVHLKGAKSLSKILN